MSDSLRLELGRVIKAVGLKGELKLLLSEDFWPEILESKNLVLEGTEASGEVKIDSVRPAGHCIILKLEGVESREEADELRDCILVFESEDLDVPGPDGVRPFQVIGLDVKLAEGGTLGKVVDLEPMPAQPLLVVKGKEREYRIPFVEPIVRDWNAEKGWIEIDPPAGLLEI